MTDTTSRPQIPLLIPNLGGNEARYLQECVDTNFVSSVGPFVDQFEQALARQVGAEHAVACVNGTAALHVALQVAGVGPGDEVFVSDFTFIATVNPIRYLGATPVLMDAEQETWNLDPALIAEELQRRSRLGLSLPRALLVAHILGQPADLVPLLEVCQRYEITLIEDGAEALGARYRGGPLDDRYVGAIGLLGCYSFNGNKIITSGGGGMIVTDDAELARRARHLTTQARLPGPAYIHDEIGYNYRMTNTAAALGLAQLEQLDAFLERKAEIARRYDQALSKLPGLTVPPRMAWSSPSMWLYSVLVDEGAFGMSRKELAARLHDAGIETRPLWTPIHMMGPYSGAPHLGGAVGEALYRDGLSLPCSVSLGHEDQSRVLHAITASAQQ